MEKDKWDETVEKIILDYRKWWKNDAKERWQKLLFLALKRKYEIKNYKPPFTKEEAGFFKKNRSTFKRG